LEIEFFFGILMNIVIFEKLISFDYFFVLLSYLSILNFKKLIKNIFKERRSMRSKTQLSFCLLLVLSFFLLAFFGFSPTKGFGIAPNLSWAQEQKEETKEKEKPKEEKPKEKKEETKKEGEKKAFDEVVKDFETLSGLFNLYRKEGKVYIEIRPEQMDKMFLCISTLESGIGELGILAGSPMEDFAFVFHKVDNNIQFIKKNLSFRADPKDPVNRAVERCFADAILASVKIESEPHPERKSYLVDLSPIFLTDIEGVTTYLDTVLQAGYNLDKDKSFFGKLQTFPKNIEIVTNCSFASGKYKPRATIVDPRSLNLNFHFSLSELPENSYRPRLEDDRIGYFTTIFKEFSNDSRKTPYVRYINRWHLEKKDPQAKLSLPKEPIVFYIENTTPLEYRDAIKEGILEWNKAFEQAGFKDAIEVRIQPDNADWDPADVRYNTVRWITSSVPSFGAMGPSRVNPLTGQILDADILIEAEAIRHAKRQYRDVVSQRSNFISNADATRYCTYGLMKAEEVYLGYLAMQASGELAPGEELPEQYIHNYLRDMTAHEVGHTLGLRHNFKGSTFHPFSELQNEDLTKKTGLVGSVMDYTPLNIALEKKNQGEYFSSTVGPYDIWAIEYGYTVMDANSPEEELPALNKIASRAAAVPGLAYGTDEDAYHWTNEPIGIDPSCNVQDLGENPLEFSETRVKLAQKIWDGLEQKIAKEGEGYQEIRAAFEMTLSSYQNALNIAAKHIGGIYFRRDHIGDYGNRVPYEVVPIERQKKAFDFLAQYAFSEKAFNFPPSLLNKLAAERVWDFEGTLDKMRRLDYPIHGRILGIQKTLLDRFYHPILIARILDSENKVDSKQQAFTLPELFDGLTKTIWSEVEEPKANQKLEISSFRRGLQREHLDKLSQILVNPSPEMPEDGRTLARSNLNELKGEIEVALKDSDKNLEPFTKAHLEESLARINQALELHLEKQLR
jgi:hypothetical protein